MANTDSPNPDERNVAPNFITEIIDDDLESNVFNEVVTRFPPEPNGYAHIGHAYASLLSYGISQDYKGRFHFRLDDTNPEGETKEFAEALMRDFKWLGLEWNTHIYYASDYYDQLFELAKRLVREGKAYVDSQSEDDISENRGTVTQAGVPSPYRERSVEENLELFEGMVRGEYAEGEHVLRAKIDMAADNMKLRDPILYRILHVSHYRTGDAWHAYPMYDFAHCLSDAIEGVTHSLCSLEFIENRAIYDWLVSNLFGQPRPYQYEFGRRSLEYTVVSKRKLIQLVTQTYVSGWDDPRMPTLAGLRRRGVRPEAIRDFVSRIGVSRTNRTVDLSLLEFAIRDDLNHQAKRVMAVLDPLKVTLTNYPQNKSEILDADYWPSDIDKTGTRKVPVSSTLYIERGDFQETPERGFRRLSVGEHVRLRHAYVIRCDEVVKDDSGAITELRCSYLPDSLGESTHVKVRSAIHWVDALEGVTCEFRLYDRLFSVAEPDAGEENFLTQLNPNSLKKVQGYVEPSVLHDAADTRYQFERMGYFWRDETSQNGALVFNRIITLKDTWGKAKPKPKVTETSKVATQVGEAPDPVLKFSEEQKAELAKLEAMGVARDDAVLLIETPELAAFLQDATKTHTNARSIAHWIVNDLRRELAENQDLGDLAFTATDLGQLVKLIDDEVINTRSASEVFADMLESGKPPSTIVKEKGLEQITNEASIAPIVARLVNENPDKAEAYKNGKTGLMGFFVGQVMRETGGTANPQLVQSLVRDALS